MHSPTAPLLSVFLRYIEAGSDNIDTRAHFMVSKVDYFDIAAAVLICHFKAFIFGCNLAILRLLAHSESTNHCSNMRKRTRLFDALQSPSYLSKEPQD